VNRLPTINDWRVIARGGPYAAPEIHGFGIVGRISGHPNRAKFPDGEAITTSRLVVSRGRVVTTESGSRYRLGTPNTEWEAWCVDATADGAFLYLTRRPWVRNYHAGQSALRRAA
jgi:hypothetical protein